MNEKPNPPKKDIYSYLAVLLCFALFVAGVCGIVSSRTASHEYKNSDDVREVSAVVQDYEPIAIKDSDGNTTDWKYEAKLSFDVEGYFLQRYKLRGQGHGRGLSNRKGRV